MWCIFHVARLNETTLPCHQQSTLAVARPPPRSCGEKALLDRVPRSACTRQSWSQATPWTSWRPRWGGSTFWLWVSRLSCGRLKVALAVTSHVTVDSKAQFVSFQVPVLWDVFALSAAVFGITSRFQASVHTLPWWRSSPFSVFIRATRCRMICRSSLQARGTRWTKRWSTSSSSTQSGPTVGRHIRVTGHFGSGWHSLTVTGAQRLATLGSKGKQLCSSLKRPSRR